MSMTHVAAHKSWVGFVPPTAKEEVKVSPSHLTDKQLCELALKGDERAWFEVVRRNQNRNSVEIHLQICGASREFAEELASLTWEQLREKLLGGQLSSLELPRSAKEHASSLWQDDEFLCRLALDGSDGAWWALVNRFRVTVEKYLEGKGVPHHLAEDITGKTWDELHKNLRKGKLESLELPGLANFHAWRRWWDYFRTHGREDPINIEPPNPPEGLGKSVDDTVDTEKMKRLLNECINQCLPPAERDVMKLHSYEGKSDAEIAALRNCKVDTIRHLKMSARHRLRVCPRHLG